MYLYFRRWRHHCLHPRLKVVHKRLLLLLLLLTSTSLFPLSLAAQTNKLVNGWAAFADVNFRRTLMDDGINYLLVPQFDEHIEALEGEVIRLRGYVMPFDYGDDPLIILSKVPYSSCFFCGEAGPESVAEIHFLEKPLNLKYDEQIVITGRLRLNGEDLNYMNFILEESRVLEN